MQLQVYISQITLEYFTASTANIIVTTVTATVVLITSYTYKVLIYTRTSHMGQI